MRDNLKLRKFGRILLAFSSTCFLIIMLWVLIDCFTSKSTATDKVITYNVKDNIDYVVTLKDNQFYTNEEANEDNFYITSLMDTLQVKFQYELVGNRFFSSDYSYNVVLQLTSKNNDEVIWKYEEEVLSKIDESVSDVMKVSIDDSVNVDVSHLYNKAKEFYDLTGYGVDLKIYVNISSDLKVSNYDEGIKDNQSLLISFPLTEKIVSIEKSVDNSVNKKVLHQYEVDEKFNTYLFIVSILLIISLIPLTIRSYISLFNLTNLDDYNRKLKKLKRKYTYLIGDYVDKPDFKKKEIIEVVDFRELVSICNEKDLLVNVFEKEKGRECWFYVIDKKDVYLYILSLDYNQIDMSNIGFNVKKSK